MAARNIKRKCESCGEWVEGKPRICPLCNDFLDHRVRKDEEREAAKLKVIEAEKAAFESKSPAVKVIIKVGRVVYAIYMAIVSFIAWLLFWIGG